MIRVLVEVCSGATPLKVAVWAESIEEALDLVGARYPGAQTTVLFPIDPEAFFAKGSARVPGMVLAEKAG